MLTHNLCTHAVHIHVSCTCCTYMLYTCCDFAMTMKVEKTHFPPDGFLFHLSLSVCESFGHILWKHFWTYSVEACL